MLKKQNNYKRPYLIAEIGINHNGSLKIAKKMIDAAHSSGFNAVKFQKRDPDICVPENQKKILRETPWGQISYLAYKKKIEFNVGHFIKLKNYAKKLKLDFSASCFDIESYKLMNKLNDFNKIPSAMITNINFLEEVAKKRKKAGDEMLKNLNPILGKYMESNNIAVVIDKKNVLMGSKKFEITSQIIEILNKEFKWLLVKR